MQAAVHAPVLDALHTHFGTCMECFASPLNCRWPRFCSLFADTDGPFGSLGSFFRFAPARGSFEANPPFDKACVARMAAHMFKLLLQAHVRSPPARAYPCPPTLSVHLLQRASGQPQMLLRGFQRVCRHSGLPAFAHKQDSSKSGGGRTALQLRFRAMA